LKIDCKIFFITSFSKKYFTGKKYKKIFSSKINMKKSGKHFPLKSFMQNKRILEIAKSTKKGIA
jgi:hypothetical protein